MKQLELILPEQTFSDAPTRTQLSNLCRDMSKFLNKVGASLIAEEMFMVNDPQCGELFNVATALKRLADFIDNPQSNSGIAVPQPMPVPMRRQ